MCYDKKGEKTKTKFVLEALNSVNYERKPRHGVIDRDGLNARAQIMSMSGMLDCAKNFRHKYGGTNCTVCNVLDDENHRINECYRYRELNLYHSRWKYEFRTIFSDDKDAVDRTLQVIVSLWNLENGRNEMK